MLIRIVKMYFKPESVSDFLVLFESVKDKIRFFEGCQQLELLQDLDNPNSLSTYSIWENAQALENYRQSDLFKNTWAKTKILFALPPLAFSSEKK
ncbi:MAG: antibiotic biosynthesis monooxygenase [Bacteroidetes bacterium]|nr:MAG: antibiotic biosynthesis monooxygenase [Bacteroidota bacterium]